MIRKNIVKRYSRRMLAFLSAAALTCEPCTAVIVQAEELNPIGYNEEVSDSFADDILVEEAFADAEEISDFEYGQGEEPENDIAEEELSFENDEIEVEMLEEFPDADEDVEMPETKWQEILVEESEEAWSDEAMMEASVVSQGYCGNPSVNSGKDVEWTLDSDGTLTISGTGAMADYNSGNPSYYTHAASIVKLVVSEGVTKVGYRAFHDLNQVTEVELPSTLNEIGSYAFSSCSALTEITVPGGVREIQSYTFIQCSALEFVIFSGGVEQIDEQAIYCPSSISARITIDIPSTVTTIDASAFDLPDSVNVILEGELYGAVQKYAEVHGYTFIAFHGPIAYGMCGENVFWDRTIGGSLTISGSGAMKDYTQSGFIVYRPAGSLPSDFTDIDHILVYEGITKIGDWAFAGAPFATYIQFPSTLEEIGKYAFYCSHLEEITVPGKVEVIQEGTFFNLSHVKRITLLEGIKSIGYQAMYQLSSDDEVIIDIPDTVTTINPDAISVTGSTSVTISGKMHSVAEKYAALHGFNFLATDYPGYESMIGCGSCGENVYWGVSSDGTLTISGSGAMADYSVSSDNLVPYYKYINDIQSISIEEGITKIGANSFRLMKIENVELPTTLKEIGSHAFLGCENLTEVLFPEGLEKIGLGGFIGCDNLNTIRIPGSVKSISRNSFYDCTNLSAVIIGEGCEEIMHDAFTISDSETAVPISISFPDSVTSISTFAFTNRIEVHIYGIMNTLAEEFAALQGYTFHSVDISTPDPSEVIHSCQEHAIWKAQKSSICQEGLLVKECTICGYIVDRKSVPAIHNWKMTVTKQPTCYSKGVKMEVCSQCGAKNTSTQQSIDMTAHSLGEWQDVEVSYEKQLVYQRRHCTNSGCSYTENRSFSSVVVTLEELETITLTTGTPIYLYIFNVGSSSVRTTNGTTTRISTSGYRLTTSRNGSVSVSTSSKTVSTNSASASATKTPSLTISRTSAAMQVGQTSTVRSLSGGYSRTNLYGLFTFSSSVPSVASVNSAGTVTAKNPGQTTLTVRCGGKSVSLRLTVNKIPLSGISLGYTSCIYSGSLKKPSVKVTAGGKTLTRGRDYTVTYANNKNVGTATVRVSGKGKYSGSLSTTFRINAASYRITFNGNGKGSVVPIYSMMIKTGKKLKLGSYKATRNGYTFDGWATSKKGKKVTSVKVNKNITLYARWKKKKK